MKNKFKIISLFLLLPLLSNAQKKYVVETKTVNVQIPKTLWGLFFEDINRGADGGIYGELIKNRSFDFPKPMTGWDTWPNGKIREGIFLINNNLLETNNPKYLNVDITMKDTVGLINFGYEEGISYKKGLPYKFTIRYRQNSANLHLRILLINRDNKPIMSKGIILPSKADEWTTFETNITPIDSSTAGKFLILFEGEGKISIDRISLFPSDVYKNRDNGLRNDLVQKIAELKPGFLRFPGGCIVEGNQLVNRYQWKTTIGPLEKRKLVQSIWADDVKNRLTPDYMESMGLGFYEYFQLCEDLKTEPMPILNAGMSCQFDEKEIVPIEQITPFVDDALDLIEFANGSVTSKWGKTRSELGHPAPFNLTYLGVGNENWGPQYAERLEIFTKAIKNKYPYIKIVNATGYSRNIPVFSYMDSVLRARKADIIDEHFYDTPEWFMKNANRYDTYDKKGPKIFVGEYAAQTTKIGSPDNKNTLKAALSEACFMTGLERNADVVSMASYAPLFGHITGWQWTPNLIWFDNSKSYNTPNYYVQQMFSTNSGTHLAKITSNNSSITGIDSLWASAVVDKSNKTLIIKVVNMNSSETDFNISSDIRLGENIKIYSLSGEANKENSFDDSKNIKPIFSESKANLTKLKPYSLTVLKFEII